MPKTKTTTIATLDELKIKMSSLKLNIRSGLEKNTNAHKQLKKEIAQFLSKSK